MASYNTKYRIEYQDITGKITIINIKEIEYNGEIIDISKVSYSPFRLKVNGEGSEKFITIKSSECNFNLLSEVDYQWFEFSNFEEKRYKVEVIIDTVYIWTGFIVPDNYREYYQTPPYDVTFVATDYLSTLKDYDFADVEGSYYFGNMTALNIIIFCLNKLELDIDIWDATDCFPEDADLELSALSQVYIDTKKYIKGFGTDTETPSNCQEVVEDILKTYGLTLYQNLNHWELKSFDSFVKNYYVYNYGGAFVENILYETVRQVDNTDLYLVKEDSELEVEGAFRKINLVHDLGEKNLSIRGGGFTGNDWNNDDEHKYFTYTGTGGTFSRSGNRGYFTKQVDDTTYTGEGGEANTNVLNAAKADYITMQVPFTRLPIPNKNIDYHLDLDFFAQLVLDYDEPADIDNPSFDHENYANFLEQQTTQLFSNLVYGCYFQVKIVNTTQGETYYHRFNPTGMDGESNVIDNRWSYGSTFDDWDAMITDMVTESGNIDPLKVKKKYNESDGSAAPSNFINDDYEYKVRMQLFSNSSSIQKLIRPNDVGYIEIKISCPYFFQIENYHSGVPTDYQININRVYQYIRKIDFTNEAYQKDNSELIVVGNNDSNIRVMQDLKLTLGDGDVLALNSLFNDSGEVFNFFTKGTVEAHLLDHTANRIINQYSAPSMRFRGTIYTKDAFISLSDIIYIEDLDKFFAINTIDYEGIEAQYKVELIELLGYSGFGNKQLSWIKNMSYSLVDNVDGYSITLNEVDND